MAKFRRRPFEIEVQRVTEETEVMTANGPVTAKVGDWLLKDSLGLWYPCNDLVFRTVYEPVDDEARRMVEET